MRKLEELITRYLKANRGETENAFEEENAGEITRDEERRLKRIYGKIDPVGKTKVIPLQTKTRYLRLAAAAVVAMAIAAAVWMFAETDLTQENTLAQEETIFTGKQFVTLPDGTTVLLNENSKLLRDPSFGTATREVTLTGEGYFDVHHDPERPFIVHSGKIKTTVLGTAFNIKAYDGRPKIIVTVERGKVAVEKTGTDDVENSSDNQTQLPGTPHESPQIVYLTANEQIALNTATNDFEKTIANTKEELQWKEQFFILNNVTMKVAASEIEKRYGVKVEFGNQELKDCIVRATFLNEEDLDDVLTMISITMNATYKKENGKIVIEGGGCD